MQEHRPFDPNLRDCYWACHFPERPWDPGCNYLIGCTGCGIAMRMHAQTVDDIHLCTRTEDGYITTTTWDEAIKLWNKITEDMRDAGR